MNFSVDFIFNFLNLALRIGLVAFVIKRYIIPGITKSIFQEKEDLSYLKKQHSDLEQSCSVIAQQIQKDEEVFAQLRLKFELWHQKVDQHEMQEKNLCMQRQQKIEDLTALKLKYLQNRRLIEAQVPNLLENVSQELHTKFANDKILSKKYQTQLLDAVGKLD